MTAFQQLTTLRNLLNLPFGQKFYLTFINASVPILSHTLGNNNFARVGKCLGLHEHTDAYNNIITTVPYNLEQWNKYAFT